MNRRTALTATVAALTLFGSLFIATAGSPGGALTASPALAEEAQSFDALRKAVDARWDRLGFKSELRRVNGVELHVATAGSGPAVVLLHGYPQSGEVWRYVAPELAKAHTVIIPDLRGLGLSEAAKTGYDLSNLSEDIHQLVRALGHDRVEVVGHDWGGAVGAIYALRYRDEVTKLVFIESAVAGAGFEELWNFSKPNQGLTFIPLLLSGSLTEELIQGREDLFLHHLWETFTANKRQSPFSDWQPYVEAMKRPGAIEAGASYYRAVYGEIDANRALISQGKLSIPVLSISGKASLGDHQKGFVEAFAGNSVKHVSIEGAAHFVPEEEPQALMEELLPFLDSNDH